MVCAKGNDFAVTCEMKPHYLLQPCVHDHEIESYCHVIHVPRLGFVTQTVVIPGDSLEQQTHHHASALLLHSGVDVEKVWFDQQKGWKHWEGVLKSAKGYPYSERQLGWPPEEEVQRGS